MMQPIKTIRLFYSNVGLDYWSNQLTNQSEFEKKQGDAAYNNIFDKVENTKSSHRTSISSIDFKGAPYAQNYPCHQNNKFYTNYEREFISELKDKLKDDDVIILSEFCTAQIDSLNLTSYYLQNYGVPEFLKRSIKKNVIQHTKSFLTGSYNDSIKISPVWKDEYMSSVQSKYVEGINTAKYIYNDENIKDKKDKYFGCVQLAKLNFNPPSDHNIFVVNLHNRFKTQKDFEYVVDNILSDHTYHANLIIIGDFNSFKFRSGPELDETEFTNRLKSNNIYNLNLDKLYEAVNNSCNKPIKYNHTRLYYRLKDWFITAIRTLGCELNLVTSSHIGFEFMLTQKVNKKRYVLKEST
jgi:hypothetical protein